VATGVFAGRPANPLRSVREAQGISLRTAARLAGIDPAHLSRVERGERSLSIESLARLASVLELKTLAGLLEQYVGADEDRSR
jgi:transcriptional regulator with XRE-family HTH domain